MPNPLLNKKSHSEPQKRRIAVPNLYVLLGVSTALGIAMYAIIFFAIIAKNHNSFVLAQQSLIQTLGVDDDLQNIKKREFTLTQFSVVSLVILGLVYFYFYTHLEKAWADWGGINVTLVGVVLSVILGAWMVSTSWFKDQRFRTPTWVYLTVIGGIILSLTLGIWGTENENFRGRDYDQTQTSGYYIIHSNNYSTSNVSVGSFLDDCDGDGCIIVVVIVLVVTAVVVLSIGVQHFWVAGCLVLLTILLLMIVQDVRATSPQEYRG